MKVQLNKNLIEEVFKGLALTGTAIGAGKLIANSLKNTDKATISKGITGGTDVTDHTNEHLDAAGLG